MRRVPVPRSRAAGHIIFHCLQLLSPQTAAMQRRCAVLFSIGASSVGNAATAAGLCGVQCSCRSCLFRRVRWGMRPLLRSMRCAVFVLAVLVCLGELSGEMKLVVEDGARVLGLAVCPGGQRTEDRCGEPTCQKQVVNKYAHAVQNTSCLLLERYGSRMVLEWFANGSQKVRVWVDGPTPELPRLGDRPTGRPTGRPTHRSVGWPVDRSSVGRSTGRPAGETVCRSQMVRKWFANGSQMVRVWVGCGSCVVRV